MKRNHSPFLASSRVFFVLSQDSSAARERLLQIRVGVEKGSHGARLVGVSTAARSSSRGWETKSLRGPVPAALG